MYFKVKYENPKYNEIIESDTWLGAVKQIGCSAVSITKVSEKTAEVNRLSNAGDLRGFNK